MLEPSTESKAKNITNNNVNSPCLALVVKLYQIRVVDEKDIVQTL